MLGNEKRKTPYYVEDCVAYLLFNSALLYATEKQKHVP